MKGGYILLNGKFYPENEPLLKGSEIVNVSFGIKESFRAENNEVCFAEEYYRYLLDSLEHSGLSVPVEWNLPRFRKDVSRLLNKNHLFLASSVTICFYPGSEETNYWLRAEEIERGFYPLNEQGLIIDFYDQEKKSSSPTGCFESSSRFIWISAIARMNLTSKNNLLISNTKEFVCEGIGVSFGYFQDNTLIVPSKDLGGYYPPLRTIISRIGQEAGYEVTESSTISKEDLLEAEEVFLIHNCRGIQKVLGLAGRRYYSTKTTLLANRLNEKVKAALSKANLM